MAQAYSRGSKRSVHYAMQGTGTRRQPQAQAGKHNGEVTELVDHPLPATQQLARHALNVGQDAKYIRGWPREGQCCVRVQTTCTSNANAPCPVVLTPSNMTQRFTSQHST